MVEADRRHAGRARTNDVRRVKPPAEPSLDERDVRMLRGEVQKRHRGRRLEERRFDPFDGRSPPIDELHHLGLGDRHAPDDDALAEIDEVW